MQEWRFHHNNLEQQPGVHACNCYRSWYILAFQAAVLPELLLLSNDCEALDAGARTGPSAMKTDGAITVQEVERKGSSSKSGVYIYSLLPLSMPLYHSCLCKCSCRLLLKRHVGSAPCILFHGSMH